MSFVDFEDMMSDDSFGHGTVTASELPSQSPGKVKPETPSEGSAICALPGCCDPKKEKGRFCPPHERISAKLIYQAGLESPEQKKVVVKFMTDINNAITHIQESDEIGGKKFVRKPKISWATWNERHGTMLTKVEAAKRKPYEKEEFLLRQENKYGRPRHIGEQMWAAFLSQGVKDDYLGYQGSHRLWLLKEEYEEDRKEKFEEASCAQGSDTLKRPDAEDVQALKRAVHDSKFRFDDMFFRGHASSSSQAHNALQSPVPATIVDSDEEAASNKQGQKRKKAPVDPATIKLEDDYLSDEEALDAKKKEGKALPQRKANFLIKSGRVLATWKGQMEDLVSKADSALKQAAKSEAEPETRSDVAARTMYMDSVKLSSNLARMWLDQDTIHYRDVPVVKHEQEEVASTPGEHDGKEERESGDDKHDDDKHDKNKERDSGNDKHDDDKSDKNKERESADDKHNDQNTGPSGVEKPSGQQAESSVKTEPNGQKTEPSGHAESDGQIVSAGEPISEENVLAILRRITNNKLFELGLSYPQHFRRMSFYESFLVQVETASQETVFQKKVQSWGRLSFVVKEIMASLKQGATELTKHVVQVEKEAKRQAATIAAKEDAARLLMRQSELAEIAKKVTGSAKTVSAQAHPCFKLDCSKFQPFPACAEEQPGADAFKLPFVLGSKDKSIKVMNEWLNDTIVQKTMTKFGLKYKKEDEFMKNNKISVPLAAKAGKEQTEAMYGALVSCAPVVDISAVSRSWMQTSWLYAMANEYQSVNLAPNSAAMIRTLWFGRVDLIVCEVTSLSKYFKELGVPIDTSNDVVFRAFQNLTAEKFEKLISAGLIAYKHSHVQGEVVYVPTGWVVAEMADASERMIFGTRKSFFFNVDDARENYQEAIKLLDAAKNPVDKMEKVLQVWKP